MRAHLAILAFAVGLSAAPVALAQERGESAIERVNEDQYLVIFRGDTRMNRREVAQQAMLRAAQLTLEQGKRWFAVTGTHSNRVDLNTVDSLDRSSQVVRDTSGGAGGGEGGATGGSTESTLGVDPGASGVGTEAPGQLLEMAQRQRTRRAYQTVLVIQIGTGGEVVIEEGAEKAEVFDAASIVGAGGS